MKTKLPVRIERLTLALHHTQPHTHDDGGSKFTTPSRDDHGFSKNFLHDVLFLPVSLPFILAPGSFVYLVKLSARNALQLDTKSSLSVRSVDPMVEVEPG